MIEWASTIGKISEQIKREDMQSMKRKPYQNVDVLGYLQKKYKIGGDTGGADDKRKTSSIPE